MPLLLLIIPLALGALLLTLGLHGRRINTHPTCRRCRYDLHALTSPTNCPECGADLTRRRATRVGVRQRRKGVAITGGVLVTLGTVLLAGQVALIAMGPKANAYKPVWMLLVEAKGSDAKRADSALSELHNRVRSGTLASSTRARLVDDALEVQASQVPWRTGWGDLIETLRPLRNVTDTQWRQYARNAIRLTARSRSTVRLGDAFAIDVTSEHRAGRNSALRATLMPIETQNDFAPMGLSVNYSDIATGPGLNTLNSQRQGASTVSPFTGISKGPQAAGKYHLEVHLNVFVHELATAGRLDVSPDPNPEGPQPDESIMQRWRGSYLFSTFNSSPPTVAAWNERFSFSIDVLPENATIITLRSDKAIASQLRADCAGLAFTLLQVDPPDNYASSTRSGTASLQGAFRQTLIPTFFDVYARLPSGQELELTEFDRYGMETWTFNFPFYFSQSGLLDSFTEMSLIFRPNPQRAARTVDITEIFGEEIVIENVPIHRPTP